MTAATHDEQPGNEAGTERFSNINFVLRIGILLVLLGAGMFLVAGTLHWTMGWAYLIVYAVVIITGAAIIPLERGLIEERTRIKRDAKDWDKVIATILSVLIPLGFPLTAALEWRLGHLAGFAIWLQILGLLLFVLGESGSFWAVATNRFFARYVRIQTERGHHVVSDGPYRIVRHPGYTSGIILITGIALAFNSWWVVALAGLAILLIVIRTALEDRTLRRELPGYEAYTKQTRYRLLPGVW